jgi:glycerol uptake facilitator-like aquaporin
MNKLLAEFFGTFWLVFAGCGSAVLAAGFNGEGSNLGIGFVGVSLAFGLTVLTMVVSKPKMQQATSSLKSSVVSLLVLYCTSLTRAKQGSLRAILPQTVSAICHLVNTAWRLPLRLKW